VLNAIPESSLFRFGRKAMSVCVGLSALWAVGYLVSPTLFVPSTSRAMINARVVSVRAPYTGDVTEVSVKAGDAVSAGQPLLRIEHPHPDARALAKLRSEAGSLSGRVDSLTAQRERLTLLRKELAASQEVYGTSYAERLEQKLAEARAAHESAQARRAFSEQQHDRRSRLSALGTAPLEEKQQMETQLKLDRANEAQSLAIFRQQEIELAALSKGVFIGSRDGSQGLPYQRQRVDDLTVLLAEVEVKLCTARADLGQVNRQIDVESQLLASTTTQDLKAPIDGVVFRRMADIGTHIEGKSEVIQLVDPHQVFVEAVVGRRDFQLIEAGDPVRLRLDGAWTWFSGSVIHKRGLWSIRTEGELAATLPPASLDGDYRIIVAMEEIPQKASASNCYLAGTRIEVTFPRSGKRAWEDLFGE
jgi:multidrug resistance efflux pump